MNFELIVPIDHYEQQPVLFNRNISKIKRQMKFHLSDEVPNTMRTSSDDSFLNLTIGN